MKTAELEVQTAQLSNPLTGLPGTTLVQTWIEAALRTEAAEAGEAGEKAAEGSLTVLFTDLDNFKEYNDVYGLLQGDELVRTTARVLAQGLPLLGPDAQLGHAGGDDFVIVSPRPVPADALREVCARFDREKLALFHPSDLARGSFHARDDKGNLVKVPLTTLSLAVIPSRSGRSTVEEAVRGTAWGEFNTYKLLYKLLQAGLVAAPGEPEAPAPPPAAPEAAALAALVDVYDRIFLLIRDVLAAKSAEVDLGRAFRAFLKNASDRTHALLQGIEPGPGRRLAVEPLAENVEHLLLLESAGSQSGALPRADLRQRLLRSALAEWTAFQVVLIHNLLPGGEAAELVSYIRAIERAGR